MDPDARRIGLELSYPGSMEGENGKEAVEEGAVLTGTIDAVKPYGVFVLLPGGKTGLLHISEMAGDTTGDLRRKYPPGSSITVQVLKVDAGSGKIALRTKDLAAAEEKASFQAFEAKKESAGSLGTMASLFKQAGKKQGRDQ
ncbi:MAG: S1 RNA-binding domain-containing protein [Deltaproteobacteria bacterium]|nr:S1 RNA-binding domain-containing protein [Deltaproteobacteria bacterium]